MLQSPEVCSLLNVHRQSLYLWDRTGYLIPRVRGDHTKSHLYSPEDVERVRLHRASKPARKPRARVAPNLAAWARILAHEAFRASGGDALAFGAAFEKALARSPAPGK